jgi:hypothetical protein
LGILHLNPTTTATATATNEEATAVVTTASSTLVERLLKHKRLQLSLEEWNDKVTEYRRWSLKKQEQHSTSKFAAPPPPATPSSATNNKSLFVQLGGGGEAATTNPYGPGADDAQDPFAKKNRKGQRAQRAKAMALQAKKEGNSVRAADSLNWRKPKTNHHNNDAVGNSSNFHQPSNKAKSTRGITSSFLGCCQKGHEWNCAISRNQNYF